MAAGDALLARRTTEIVASDTTSTEVIEDEWDGDDAHHVHQERWTGRTTFYVDHERNGSAKPPPDDVCYRLRDEVDSDARRFTARAVGDGDVPDWVTRSLTYRVPVPKMTQSAAKADFLSRLNLATLLGEAVKTQAGVAEPVTRVADVAPAKVRWSDLTDGPQDWNKATRAQLWDYLEVRARAYP